MPGDMVGLDDLDMGHRADGLSWHVNRVAVSHQPDVQAEHLA